MGDWDPTYDEGLNKGIVARGHDGRPPDYYREGNIKVAYAKAMAFGLITIAPYYTVLDQLGSITPESFMPCNDQPCHYMRLFDSRFIPGSGSDIMAVRNGLRRPMAMRYSDYQVYACPETGPNETAREWGDKIFGSSCPLMNDRESLKSQGEKYPALQGGVDHETEMASQMTLTVRIAFFVTKLPLLLFTFPFNMAAKVNDRWGMDHIPSASCPGLSPEEMRFKCADMKIQKGVHNHLHTWGPSRDATFLFLILWGVTSGIHDVQVLHGVSEKTTLLVGTISTFMCGAGVAAMFCWAMAATEVFVAELEGFSTSECVCFYQLGEVTQLVGLSTPFAMLAAFAIKVQLQGLNSLFGDSTYYQPYIIPHYLAKQSYLWTWAVLTSPKQAGTIEAKPREYFEIPDWYRLFQLQQFLQFWRQLVINGFVALSASPFMIAFKELLTGVLIGKGQTPTVNFIILYILLPLPSILTWALGAFDIMQLYYTCIQPDVGETFADQIDSACPNWIFGERQSNWLKAHNNVETTLAYTAFVVLGTVSLVWTAAVAQGLCPDLNVLLGKEEVVRPTIAQAELWGACGFIFVGYHLQKGIAFVFSTWDDVESLKTLGYNGRQYLKVSESEGGSNEPLIGSKGEVEMAKKPATSQP